MGDIADDHYAKLSWNGELYVDDDGYPTVPPFEPQHGYGPVSGGMDLWFSQAAERSAYVLPPPPSPTALPDFDRADIHKLLKAQAQGKIRPCPCCGSAARVIEYPLGIACSRWSCTPGKQPIYLSDAVATANGFGSVIEFWNASALNPERDALVWQEPRHG